MTGRDPVIDSVRALAIAGVVLGHWLVTSVVLVDGALVVDSPLRWVPELSWLSWIFQTLGLFFFTGGFAAARSRTPWTRKAGKLVLPVVVLLGGWVIVLFGLSMRGLPQQTVLTVGYLVVTPLWFLVVYVVLLAVTPWMRGLGWWGLAVVVAVAFLDFGWVNVLAVWWVPWQVGSWWPSTGSGVRGVRRCSCSVVSQWVSWCTAGTRPVRWGCRAPSGPTCYRRRRSHSRWRWPRSGWYCCCDPGSAVRGSTRARCRSS